MYIEYEVVSTNDFVELIKNELFPHFTRDDAGDCLISIINEFLTYYDKEIK